jgi:hypothetical protein
MLPEERDIYMKTLDLQMKRPIKLLNLGKGFKVCCTCGKRKILCLLA